MPDLNIETTTWCPQHRSRFEVSGSKGNVYTVETDDDGMTCTCPAFKYSADDVRDKMCKHVRLVRAHGCFHSPFGDAGPNDLADHGVTLTASFGSTVEQTCPGCDQPMLPVRIAV